MKTISPEELKTILENHKHWVYEDCDGWEDMNANLSDVNLSNASLSHVILRGADLSRANLRGADLSRVDLSRANLRGADLSRADLIHAILRDADLSDATLRGAILRDADLGYASLSDATLRGADLSDSTLRGATLRGADLSDATLSRATLRGADLGYATLSGANLNDADLSDTTIISTTFRGAKNLPYIPMICPEEGKFIGWKKAEVKGKSVIVKLEIPISAKRSSSTSRKCRCDKAKVIEIYNLNGTVAEERKCHSIFNNAFIYEVGTTVKADGFNEDRWSECSQGIHFFINRQEAINY